MNPVSIPQPFRALVLKELRGNARWMVLGFVLTFAVLAITLVNSGQTPYPSFMQMLPYFQVLAIVMGVMIGVMTIISEHRGDGYGFMVHRPLGLTTIFAGKVTGGLILYLGAVALPMAVIAVWASQPGRFPEPFDLLMLRAPFVDLLTGAVAFFLAFLCTMRDARWYATRWLGLLGVLLVSGGALAMGAFLSAAGLTIFALGIAAWAAWGAFVAGGGARSQSTGSRIALTLALGGSLVVLGQVIRPSLAWLGHAVHPEQPSQLRATIIDSLLVVTPIGPVTMVKNNGVVISATDTSGTPIGNAKLVEYRDSVRTESLAIQERSRARWASEYRGTDDIYMRLTQQSAARRVFWYFVHRSGQVVGYDWQSKRAIAWAGPNGFTESPLPPEEKFAEPLLESDEIWAGENVTANFLRFHSTVFIVNPFDRLVRKRFVASSDEQIIDATSGGDGWLFVTTTRATYLEPPVDGLTTRIEHPVPVSSNEGIVVQRIRRPQSNAVFITYLAPLPAGVSRPPAREMIQVAPDGKPVARFQVPQARENEVERADPIEEITAALADPGSAPVIRSFNPADDALRHSSWFALLAAVLALASGGINAMLARRHAFTMSRLALWSAAGVVLGPFGIALMLATVDWPASEVCLGCNRRRVMGHERCEHCAQAYPPPESDGTEILEPAFAGMSYSS